MTIDLSSLPTKESNEMKSKPVFIIVISAVLIAGLVTWAYRHWDEETPTSPPIASQSNAEKSTGHKWFSYVQSEPPKTANKLTVFSDADGHIVDLHGLTISQYVKTQYEAANTGDKKAAFNIYSAETVCAQISTLQREITSLPVESPLQAVTPSKQAVIEAAKAICTDFNISSRERLDYLLVAAKGGVAEAQIAFSLEIPDGLDMTDSTDPRLIQWQKDGISYLNQAAIQGNEVGLTRAASIYEDGNALVSKDLQLALTYQIAAKEIYSQDKNDAIITRISNQLTPDQVAAATTAANHLVNSCCNKP